MFDFTREFLERCHTEGWLAEVVVTDDLLGWNGDSVIITVPYPQVPEEKCSLNLRIGSVQIEGAEVLSCVYLDAEHYFSWLTPISKMTDMAQHNTNNQGYLNLTYSVTPPWDLERLVLALKGVIHTQGVIRRATIEGEKFRKAYGNPRGIES